MTGSLFALEPDMRKMEQIVPTPATQKHREMPQISSRNPNQRLSVAPLCIAGSPAGKLGAVRGAMLIPTANKQERRWLITAALCW
ncbi:hypothetical protein GX51_07690 [Blastomyces parvus]|uniref:Uncharacterized protein n=1 Tax=Blastomyces parvus TaxID=2060905 RepID=A0A2B7WJK7_9EURO|nr:hypothetical protein GX51_07690 [Blastomyces parvus]